MSILDTFKRFTQPYSDDDYTDYEDEDTYEEEEEQATVRPRRANPFATATESNTASAFSGSTSTSTGFNAQVVNMGSGKQEVVLFHAKTFDDAAKAADELRKKKAVILNMENVDKALTRRVVDFLSGAIYALDGSVKKVAQSTYLFCPHNMGVVGDLENVQVEMESSI
jgi:cell division inhibitor SepF